MSLADRVAKNADKKQGQAVNLREEAVQEKYRLEAMADEREAEGRQIAKISKWLMGFPGIAILIKALR